MRKVVLLSICLFFASCAAESIISVQPNKTVTLEQLKKNHDIFGYYYLPKTVLKMRIPIEVNSRKKGVIDSISNPDNRKCFLNSLNTYFGWVDVVEPKEKFTLDKKIVLSPISRPDTTKRYAIAYKNSKSISQTLNVSLGKDGRIQSGEFAQKSEVFEIVKKSTEIVGTAVGSIMGLGGESDGGISVDSFQCIPNERAKILIEQVISLGDLRENLVRTYANSVNTTDVVKFHLKQVDDLLLNAKNEILGKISKKTHYITIMLDPTCDKTSKKPCGFTSKDLIKINPNKGVIVEEMDYYSSLSNEIKVEKDHKTKKGDTVNVLRLVVENRTVPKESEVLNATTTISEGKIKSDAFLYYNIPAQYNFSLVYKNKPISTFSSSEDKKGKDDYSVFFPQLGKVGFLPLNFKEASVVYYEDTGGLKSAKISKEASTTAENIDGYFQALDSINKTFKAIKEANKEEPPATEESEEVEEDVIRLIIVNDVVQEKSETGNP